MSKELKLNSIRIGLTRTGLLYIALTLALGMVAVNAGNNLLYLATSGLLALLFLSGLLAYSNLKGLSTNIFVPEEIYAGRPVTIYLEVRNRKRHLPSFLLEFGANEGETLIEVAPSGEARIPLRVSFAKRGMQPVGEWKITSVFPFGLVRRGGSFDPGGMCTVYPKPMAVPWSILEKAERRGEGLDLPVAGVGGDYRGIRDYLQGDPISRIHWKGWLRYRSLMTKEFDSEGAAPVTFSYDAVPGPGREERLSQLTWLVRAGLRRGRAVGLDLPGKSFPPQTGRAHQKNLLTALALFGGDLESR